MRKIFIAIGIACLSLVPKMIFTCEDTWSNHWVNGLKLHENGKYYDATIEFTQAIEMTKNEQDESHIFLRTSRARNFLQLEQFYKALEDIYFVIDCPTISKKNLIDAVEVRMRAYAGLKMINKFEEDYIWYQSLNPFFPVIEYTEKYVIIHNCDSLGATQVQKDLVYGLFIASGFCVDKSKIVHYGDVIIIEREANLDCPCLFKIKEFGTRAHVDVDDMLRRQIEGCKAYCDNSANTALIISGRLIALNPAFAGAVLTIQIIRESCKACCSGNGGFYVTCIQPIVDYYNDMQEKINKILDGKRPMGYPRRG